jgi:hypothetical protein
MADRQWVNPIGGAVVHETGTEEYILPIGGAAFQEDQLAPVGMVFKPPPQRQPLVRF